MRKTISKSVVAALAALSLSASLMVTAEPASAAQWHGGGGGWHGGYRHPGHWRGGVWYNGWWGPAVAAGVLLGAAAAAYPYYGYGYGYDACWQNRPVYSAAGVYLGYQMVNVCQ